MPSNSLDGKTFCDIVGMRKAARQCDYEHVGSNLLSCDTSKSKDCNPKRYGHLEVAKDSLITAVKGP